MKTTKRLLSCLLVLAMLFALAIPAFAADEKGTITITDASNGETYYLIKVFDAKVAEGREAKGDGITYEGPVPAGLDTVFSWNEEKGTVEPATGATDKDGNFTEEALKTVKDYAKGIVDANAADTFKTTVAANGQAVFSDLDAGYYIVYTSFGTSVAVAVDSITPSISITEKTVNGGPEKPDPEKPLKNIKVDDEDKQDVSVDKGEAVSFSVEFKGANYKYNEETKQNEKVYEYSVVDKPAGMTIDWDNVVVKVGDDTLAPNDTASGAGYKVTDNTLTIYWTDNHQADGNSLYNNDVLVVVKYTGTLNEGETEASNSAKIDFNGGKEGIPEETPVKVYSTTVTINKHETNNTSKTLDGAKFKLYRLNPETQAKEYYVLGKDGKVTWGTETAATEVTTENGGAAKFVGLADGTYYLQETLAPNGYNLLDDDVTVTVEALKETDSKDNPDVKVHVSAFTVNVPNARGTVLPSTGGIGTTMFYVVGGLLVAAAVVVLVSKKRMGAEQ